jgi:hypothetical protein
VRHRHQGRISGGFKTHRSAYRPSVSPTLLVVDGPVAFGHLWRVLAIAWIARRAGDAGRTTVAGFRRYRCASPSLIRVIFADPRTSSALCTQLHRLGQFVAATFAHELAIRQFRRRRSGFWQPPLVGFLSCLDMPPDDRSCQTSQSTIIARLGTYRSPISHPPKALSETSAFAVETIHA